MRSTIALVLLVFVTSSCHRKQVAVPLPPQPQPTTVEPAEQAPPVPAPSTIPAPEISPPASTGPTQTAPAKDESKYQTNKPPEQPPAPKRSPRPVNPAPATPVPQAPTPSPPPVAESPRLGDVLTPEQQNQFNAAIDQGLAHAQGSLGSLSNRQLTKEQEATVAQVRNFIQQAQEKRKDDLAAAKSLAERAEVLAHDLVASLR